MTAYRPVSPNPRTHLPARRNNARFHLIAALAGCLLISSRLFAESKPATGDAIVVGSIGDASRLLPILATDSASGDIVGLLFNGLLKYNERLEIVGDSPNRGRSARMA